MLDRVFQMARRNFLQRAGSRAVIFSRPVCCVEASYDCAQAITAGALPQ